MTLETGGNCNGNCSSNFDGNLKIMSSCHDRDADGVDEISCNGGTERTSTSTGSTGDELSLSSHLNIYESPSQPFSRNGGYRNEHENLNQSYESSAAGSGLASTSASIPVSGSDKKIPVTTLDEIQYAHGGYAGAAPLLMDDKKWMMILQILMPDEHEILSSYAAQVAEKPDPLKIMKWAENNPVVAAFGMLHSKPAMGAVTTPRPKARRKEASDINNMLDMARSKIIALEGNKAKNKRIRKRQKPAIEWDVFLDPTIVKDVDAALKVLEKLSVAKNKKNKIVSDDEIIAANIEVDRQVSRLLNRMMLAHGSTTQLLVEAVGVISRYNFSRVKRSGQEIKRRLREGHSSSSLNCCCADNVADEDGTMEYGSVHSNSTSTNRSAESFKKKIRPSDVRTSAIFVSRWLHIFASALKMGRRSENDVSNMILRQKRRHEAMQKSRSFQKRTSEVLRGVMSSLSFDNDNASVYIPDDPGRQFTNPSLCGLFLCLGMNDPDSLNADHSDTSMAESASLIKKYLGENLRLVLDMKSRHVPARVWGRLIDHLRSRGLYVEATGSFDIDELRRIKACTSSSITSIRFFHSAGDLQRACHANEVKKGDTVYFNGGSLFGKRSTVCEAPTDSCWTPAKYSGIRQVYTDGEYQPIPFKPYAFPKDEVDDIDIIADCKATLADYQRHFDLQIGLYVQEFSIGSEELDSLARLVNKYPDVYKLGLAWGGLNGFACKGVKGDGYWSQRYVGRNWANNAAPSNKMNLLSPEDHHVVQKVFLAASCGQVTTVNHIMDEEDIMCQGHNQQLLDFTQTGNLKLR